MQLKAKKGMQTSEFYVVLVPVIMAILTASGVVVTPDQILYAINALAAVYVAARTYLKKVRIQHAGSVRN